MGFNFEDFYKKWGSLFKEGKIIYNYNDIQKDPILALKVILEHDIPRLAEQLTSLERHMDYLLDYFKSFWNNEMPKKISEAVEKHFDEYLERKLTQWMNDTLYNINENLEWKFRQYVEKNMEKLTTQFADNISRDIVLNLMNYSKENKKAKVKEEKKEINLDIEEE